jgi:MFS family permease
MAPTRRSQRGLDWLCFFVADVQAGLGPLVAAHLATLHFRQRDIGLVLTMGALVGLAAQAPTGALVDASPRRRRLVALGIVGVGVGALLFATCRGLPALLAAQLLHALVGGLVGPGIAALTLGLVGTAGLGARLGRNRSFDAAGNLVAAVGFALAGYVLPSAFVFAVAAALSLPALLSLVSIRRQDVDVAQARGGAPSSPRLLTVFFDRRLLCFAVCSVLFHFANAAMLPLLGASLASTDEQHAVSLMSACVLVTQFVVTFAARPIGRWADRWGRKPLLLAGFAVLPLRGVLCALATSTPALLATQILDGIGAAVFGVCSVLVVADLTRGSGRFNVTLGAVGMAVGIGAALSNVVAGAIADHMGRSAAFVALAVIAFIALVVAFAVPETGAGTGTVIRSSHHAY